MTCPHCGADVKPNASFCIRCGHKLTQASLATDVTEAVPAVTLAADEPTDAAASDEAIPVAEASTPPTDGAATSGASFPAPLAPSASASSEALAQLIAAETREMALDDLRVAPASLPVGSQIGEHYQITRVVEQSPTGTVYEALDLWTQEHCWSCGAAWTDSDDEHFCEHCGAQRRGKKLLLRDQSLRPELLTEAATVAPNAIFAGEHLLIVIGEEDVPVTAKRARVAPDSSVPPAEAAPRAEATPPPLPITPSLGDTQPVGSPSALPDEPAATMELAALLALQADRAAQSTPPGRPDDTLRAHMLVLPTIEPPGGDAFAASAGDAPTVEGAFEATLLLGSNQPLWEVRLGIASDVGRARQGRPNEDTALGLTFGYAGDAIPAPLTLALVADGLGGHENGQRAGRLAARLVARHVLQHLWIPLLAGETAPMRDPAELGTVLRAAIQEANLALCKMNRNEGSDMGCTITALLLHGEAACVANVGDSRTYLCTGRDLVRVTTDHSLVARLVAAGMLTPDEVYTHPQRSQIYRSLGDENEVQVDLFPHRLRVGESFLLCSDGLWEMVRDPQIAHVVTHAAPGDPQALARQLIALANENGGEDNVSVVVAQVVG